MSETIHSNLAHTRIAPDLCELVAAFGVTSSQVEEPIDVIIELNADFPGGARTARELLVAAYLSSQALSSVRKATAMMGMLGLTAPAVLGVSTQGWDLVLDGSLVDFDKDDQFFVWKSLQTEAYLFAQLTPVTIVSLAGMTARRPDGTGAPSPIYKLWRDHEVHTLVYESVRTIKVDAARAAFGSAGSGIVWAVADTGVDAAHPHFATYQTLQLPAGLRHCDFTTPHPDLNAAEASALTDGDGHGTHVSGIIAGASYLPGSPSAKPGVGTVLTITVSHTIRTGDNQTRVVQDTDRTELSGIAPLCKILSLKVLQSGQAGVVSNLLAAIGYVQQINNYGRDIKIHGLNLSLGYPFDAAWFAAGQSPLCAEVNRLVKCGVSVVVAAGNAGYGRVAAVGGASAVAALPCTIADPGNADLAVTVGSTHRNRPHVFGVSYFSAKGPTADGRNKPDLVAPGERIVSCQANGNGAVYKEDSGTSMAAPHVSAAIAAFLSVRSEFIGRPEDVKAILIDSAIDLKRRPEFQGAGLIDLMKALQSV